MSDIAIKVENVSKLYHIGAKSSGSLIESINNSLYKINPFKRKPSIDETEFWALKDLSFEIKKGDVVGVIGKNGAGKSTLLKILSRITEPTHGKIEINGRVASLLEVGTGFHPELSGRENIFLNGSILGMTKREIQSKFDEIVDFSGIEKFIDTPVKHYSSGMYVRLAFSVAAHLEPEVLIIDEVLAVGDAEFQKKCLGKMQDVAGHGRTVLFVSHNMAPIRNLCNSGILLSNGHIASIGNIDKVIDEYEHKYFSKTNTFEFVNTQKNEMPVNILSAKIIIDNKHLPKLDGNRVDCYSKIAIEIKAKFQNAKEGISLNFYLSRNGVLLYRSFDVDLNPDLLMARKNGEYTYRIEIPAPIKAGNYFVDLEVGLLNVAKLEFYEQVLSFTVEELSFDPGFKSFAEKRQGVVAQELVWNEQFHE